jgi:hypothetical protein
MKRIIFLALAIGVSASAFSQSAETGFASNKTTEAAACQAAKIDAQRIASNKGKDVTHFSNCECSQNNGGWSCTVNADTQKK